MSRVSLNALARETRQLRQLVRRSDTNKDGVVSKDELGAVAAKVSQRQARALESAFEYASQRGAVTPEALSKLLNAAHANARRADRNQDGFVSAREARHLGRVSRPLAGGDSFDGPAQAGNGGAAGAAAAGQAGARAAAPGGPGAQRINQVLDQLDPAHNPRYQPRGRRGTPGRTTYCNQFAQEALRRMGVPYPTGNANAMNRWFNREGAANGWRQVSAEEAQRMVNEGHPAVATWRNPTGVHGHIGVLRPGELPDGSPRMAQAGGRNFNDGTVRQGFGRHEPQYFVYVGN